MTSSPSLESPVGRIGKNEKRFFCIIYKKMTDARIKVTDQIYFNENSFFLIKVTTEDGKTFEEDFCYVQVQDYAKALIKSLASRLKEELESSSEVKNGWVKITINEEDPKTTVISKQKLGRLYNGPVTPYYTLTFKEVNKGYLV